MADRETLGDIVGDVERHLVWARENAGSAPQPRRAAGPEIAARSTLRRDPRPEPPSPPTPSPPSPDPEMASLPGTTGEAARSLAQVREELGNCQRCRLHEGRTHIVFGIGNPHAEICFVGEGPGADEDLRGEPFVGKAGQLLDRMIEAMGLQRGDVYICNVVKCRPPQNRNPEPDEMATCSPFLRAQLRAIQPKVIVALGKIATQALLDDKTAISRLRGRWRSYENIPLLPTFHPAYLLRSPGEKSKAWEDLKAVVKYLGRELPRR